MLVWIAGTLCQGNVTERSPLRTTAPCSKGSCLNTWFVKDVGNRCVCGKTYDGAVSCDNETKDVGVADCYCMTYDSTRNTAVLAACLFNCVNVTKSYSDNIYHHVPRDLGRGDDNNSMCGYLHRQGTLCGQCMATYYPAAYSYTFECIECNSSQLFHWLLYIAAAYVPLTMFVIVILVFRVSVVSPKLYGVVSLAQNLVSPLNIHVLLAAAKYDSAVNIIMQVVVTVLNIWNLNFFRTLWTGMCLHIPSLLAMGLDYLIAVYPMIVTIIAFVVLQLHDRGFKPVLYLWRPFHLFFARFRREWDLDTTLIDAFITFFILSTTKLLHVSVSFLLTTTVYTADGKTVGLYLYEDINTKFFSLRHLPYGLLAIFIMILLIFLPICLLIFYQFTCCQRCLTVTKLKGHLLDKVMYSFNQYYRDGRDGSMDCRWFAAFYIVTRLGLYANLFITMTTLTYNLLLVYSIICALVVVVAQPYKEEYEWHNAMDPVITLIPALFFAGMIGVNLSNKIDRRFVKFFFVYTGIVSLFPLVYICIVALWWVCGRGVFGLRLAQQEARTPDLPDRILNSAKYGNSSQSSHIQCTIYRM